MNLLGAIISSAAPSVGKYLGGDVGQSIGEGVSNYMETEAAHDWQMNLLNTQHQWAVEDWERMNEYNTPLNQMKRLQEAGLNPLLSDATGGLASSPVTQPHVTESELAEKASMMNAIRENQLLESQQAVNDAQANKLNQEADFNKEKSETERSTRELVKGLLKSNIDVNGTTCAVHLADVELKGKQEDEIEQHIVEMAAHAKALNENANLFNIQSKFFQKQIDWYDAEMQHKLYLLAQEAGYYGAAASERVAQAAYLGEQLETQKELTYQAGLQSEDMRYELDFKKHPAVEKCRATLILLKQKKAQFSLDAPDWTFKVGGYLDACSGGAQLFNTALNDAGMMGVAAIPKTVVKAAPK